ncbi:MAG: FecR domain-containing protein [Gemmatimonadota bacterium]
MRTPIDFEQLDRFLSGESSAEEQERLARRAVEDPELRQLLDSLATNVRKESGTWNTDQAWSDLQKRGQRRKALWRPGLAAAALLVLAVGTAVVYRSRTGEVSEQISSAAQEYRTARGERRDITLSDGSEIVLSAGSAVLVPADFAQNRTVRLEGEAFFEVEPDASRPFTVLSGPARTRVLGTAFNVSAHPGGAIEVAVVSGRVELRHDRANDGSGAVLNPGQSGRLEGNAQIVVRTVDLNDYIAWRQGRLVFRDVSLSEVTATLERWYEVDLEISDAALAQSHVNAFFEKQNLNEILDVLAETLDARYERTGSSITFYRK